MTIKEFQAWLDGYSAAIQGPPDVRQWELIKSKIAKLSDSEVFPVKWYHPKPRTTYDYSDEINHRIEPRTNQRAEPKDPNSVYDDSHLRTYYDGN